jgi:hypothetical protein
MNFALLSVAIAVIGSVSIGGVMMIFGLKNAPVGYEDETGFHYGHPDRELIPVTTSNDFEVCLEEELVGAGR